MSVVIASASVASGGVSWCDCRMCLVGDKCPDKFYTRLSFGSTSIPVFVFRLAIYRKKAHRRGRARPQTTKAAIPLTRKIHAKPGMCGSSTEALGLLGL